MRVLLVEDDVELARRLAAALAEAGYAVDHAVDGVDAEFRGQTETYDAAVLDLGLPRMDGLAVLDAWRGNGVRLPVIVLTARRRSTSSSVGNGLTR